VLAFGVAIAFTVPSNIVQLPLKRLAVERATLSGPVTWKDVFCAREIVRTNEINGKIIHISKGFENGQDKMLLFTTLYRYEMDYDLNRKWQVKCKAIYMR